MTLEKELAVALEAAEQAGTIMQEYRENGFSIDRKDAYTDMVTEADVACEEAVIGAISDAFPDDAITGEEDGDTAGTSGRRWVIDPIDGTKNFVHGFPFYCTSIALKDGEETVLGVVHAPALGWTFHAVQDHAAVLNGETIQPSDITRLPDALIMTRLSERHEPSRDIETPFLRDLLRQPSAFRRAGSAAINPCMIAAGMVDGYATISINEWDIAAGAFILEQAGGTTRIQDSVRDGYLEFVASNGPLQEELERVFDRHTQNHSI